MLADVERAWDNTQKPDIKWRKIDDISDYRHSKILRASRYVKKGGILVYSHFYIIRKKMSMWRILKTRL